MFIVVNFSPIFVCKILELLFHSFSNVLLIYLHFLLFLFRSLLFLLLISFNFRLTLFISLQIYLLLFFVTFFFILILILLNLLSLLVSLSKPDFPIWIFFNLLITALSLVALRTILADFFLTIIFLLLLLP